MLEDYIPAPDLATASEIINTNRLTVVGQTSETGISAVDPGTGQAVQVSQYKIKVVYTRWDEELDALKIEQVGIWLPGGYEYFSAPGQEYSGAPIISQLEGLDSPFRSTPDLDPSNGNQMIVWNWEAPGPGFC